MCLCKSPASKNDDGQCTRIQKKAQLICQMCLVWNNKRKKQASKLTGDELPGKQLLAYLAGLSLTQDLWSHTHTHMRTQAHLQTFNYTSYTHKLNLHMQKQAPSFCWTLPSLCWPACVSHHCMCVKLHIFVWTRDFTELCHPIIQQTFSSTLNEVSS